MSSVAATRESIRYVEQSWNRCRTQYALSQTTWRMPQFVRAADLDDRRDRAGFVFPIACAELACLSRTLQGVNGVVITDREAVILACTGTQRFTELGQKLGLRPGAVWQESEQGTNGMGTCVAESAPVAIERQHHYLQKNAVLSCYAVPVLDGRGNQVGVVNASTLGSLDPYPTMALLDLVARNIEHRSLLSHRADHYILRLHPQREFVSTCAEAILLINRDGIVESVNRAALEVLAAPTYASIWGVSVYNLLGIDIPYLQRISSARNTEPRFLPHAPYFAVVQPPIIEELPPDPSAPSSIVDAMEEVERRALQSALDRSKGNVSAAAIRLGISRRTLHRKLRQYAICRERYQ